MRKIVFLLISILILFSSAKTDNVPCGDSNFFRVGLDDLPGFNCCLSDSFKIVKKEIDRDTFFWQDKSEFIIFDMYSTESNVDQIIYALLKNKKTGKVFQSRLTCENSAVYFSNLIQIRKLHQRIGDTSDFSVSVMKIVNGGSDTLKCTLGDFHLVYKKIYR